ncbi:diaminopimelate decarboxylase [Bacteroidota bacterium]
MNHFIPINKISASVSTCLKSGLFDPIVDTSIVFYDFSHLKHKIELLKEAFPINTFHTAAVKANPLDEVLKFTNKLELGAEVASEGELYLAQKSGFKNQKIVFDSPAKTYNELEFALKNNIQINADSLMEIDRIAKIKKNTTSISKIGLRINPQVGYGKIESTSLAGEYSKFGVPIKSHLQEIIDYYVKYDWLIGVHLHIGSQGCEMEMLINGIESGLKLIVEINKKIKSQNREIIFLDIGGGLPISYHHDIAPTGMTDYGNKIKDLLAFFNLENMHIVTEFGRFLHANSGFIVSKVEYVKHYENSNTLIIHSGADMLLRECLNPGNWYHEITLLNSKGELKQNKSKINYHIAGPLCFANDIIARNIELPEAQEGDYLVIHDSGGYTFGMWSKYVSRNFPKVIAYDDDKYKIIRKRETPEDILKFWSF